MALLNTSSDGTGSMTLTDLLAYTNDLDAAMFSTGVSQQDINTADTALTDYQTQKYALNNMTSNYYNQSRSTGNINVNVYGTDGQDVQELATLVSQELQNMIEQEEEALR